MEFLWTIIKFFTVSDSVCRGHSMKLCKEHVKLNHVRKFIFIQRIINAGKLGNDLPESVIQYQSVNTYDCHQLRAEMEMGHLSRPMTHVTHRTVDP